jgi:hypothetical protein
VVDEKGAHSANSNRQNCMRYPCANIPIMSYFYLILGGRFLLVGFIDTASAISVFLNYLFDQ